MEKYRKKPVTIEAVQMTDTLIADIVDHLTNKTPLSLMTPAYFEDFIKEKRLRVSDECLVVTTLEGDHHISSGDFLIKGVKGELYPCKPDIFELTYDKVE